MKFEQWEVEEICEDMAEEIHGKNVRIKELETQNKELIKLLKNQ